MTRAGSVRFQSSNALCSQIIRHILVDHVRRRRFAKRGGKVLSVPFDEVLLVAESRGIEVLALDQALDTWHKLMNASAELWSCVTSEG
jgi:hypothetical protein